MSSKGHSRGPHGATAKRRALDVPVRPTCAVIDFAALGHNYDVVRRLTPNAEVLAVVKANAYGHGAVEIARALEQRGVRFLGVALVEEGLELRNAGITAPILVLGGSYTGGYELMVDNDLIPTVFRDEHLAQLSLAARARGKDVVAHLKVDTGMGRIGVLMNDLPAFLQRAAAFSNVRLDGLLSHFANADLADQAVTKDQISHFRSALKTLRERGHNPSFRHLSNSAGVLDVPEVADGVELNLVRPGLMLYGVSPAGWLQDRAPLQPVLSWRTGITHLKQVEAGTAISYGGTFVTRRTSLIATLPVGYADGYDRAYSNKASVLIRGQRAPLAGRVCMDMCMADVTDIASVSVGDEVVLLGEQAGAQLPVEELAALSDTIPYEILCGVGARVPRVAR